MTTRLDEFFDGLPARLDVHEVASLLGVSTKGVYTWVNLGVIPAYKVGASWLILRDELKDTLASSSNLRQAVDPDQMPEDDPPEPDGLPEPDDDEPDDDEPDDETAEEHGTGL